MANLTETHITLDGEKLGCLKEAFLNLEWNSKASIGISLKLFENQSYSIKKEKKILKKTKILKQLDKTHTNQVHWFSRT